MVGLDSSYLLSAIFYLLITIFCSLAAISYPLDLRFLRIVVSILPTSVSRMRTCCV